MEAVVAKLDGRYWPKADGQFLHFSTDRVAAFDESRRSRCNLEESASDWLVCTRKQPVE